MSIDEDGVDNQRVEKANGRLSLLFDFEGLKQVEGL